MTNDNFTARKACQLLGHQWVSHDGVMSGICYRCREAKRLDQHLPPIPRKPPERVFTLGSI
jgi:hypothetical protein